jgi:hypothetical protein
LIDFNNKISIKLDQELSCEHICKNVQDLINRYTKYQINLSNYLLVFELRQIQETDQTLSLRIGVKP